MDVEYYNHFILSSTSTCGWFFNFKIGTIQLTVCLQCACNLPHEYDDLYNCTVATYFPIFGNYLRVFFFRSTHCAKILNDYNLMQINWLKSQTFRHGIHLFVVVAVYILQEQRTLGLRYWEQRIHVSPFSGRLAWRKCSVVELMVLIIHCHLKWLPKFSGETVCLRPIFYVSMDRA